MGFQMGAFRFNRDAYTHYSVYCTQVSGLNEKADVKIAGVSVGWVESVSLIENRVHIALCVKREYQLYADAQACIRQDGLLGSKYLEIIPGNSLLTCIPAGGTLAQKQQEHVAMDDLLYQCKQTIDSFNTATEKIAAVAQRLDKYIATHEPETQAVLRDVQELAKPAQDILRKINDGNGLLGKLIHDDMGYTDVTRIANNVRGIFSKFNNWYCLVDGHVEALCKFHDHAGFTNGKGYLNFRIHPAQDYFCLAGLTASFKGRVRQCEEWCVTSGLPQNTCRHCYTRKFNALSLNLQLGKIFRNSALRVGLFEGTAGIALDWDIPLGLQWMRWISTFELFDIRGKSRFHDARPHLKWLNKFYFMNELYVALGADDFISKCNKTFLFGAGVRVLF